MTEAIDYCANKICKEQKRPITDTRTETYPGIEQVAKMPDADLWRWNKQGFLHTVEIGGKRRYRMSDVKKMLENKAGSAVLFL